MSAIENLRTAIGHVLDESPDVIPVGTGNPLRDIRVKTIILALAATLSLPVVAFEDKTDDRPLMPQELKCALRVGEEFHDLTADNRLTRTGGESVPCETYVGMDTTQDELEQMR